MADNSWKAWPRKDAARGFVGRRGTQNARIVVAPSDDLQPDRKPRSRQPAWHGCRRLHGLVAPRGEARRFAQLRRQTRHGWRFNVKSRTDQQVVVGEEAMHLASKFFARRQ